MGTFDYTSLLNTADRLIKRFGGEFVYTSVVAQDYYPVTRVQTLITTTTTVKAAFVGPNKTFVDGTLVPEGEGRLLVDAKGLSITPDKGDSVKINGVDYYVQRVKHINPSGAKVVLYILTLTVGISQDYNQTL